MPRTPTLPINEPFMWRKLIARTHPDTGGEHELFIWTMTVRDAICGGGLGPEIPRREHYDHPSRRREASTSGADRIPFDSLQNFEVLSRRALALADEVEGVYGGLLHLLADCYPVQDGPLYDQQRRGATYKSLAAIGHKVGMTKPERVQWYRIAESVPLSQRHAGHILSKLQRAAA